MLRQTYLEVEERFRHLVERVRRGEMSLNTKKNRAEFFKLTGRYVEGFMEYGAGPNFIKEMKPFLNDFCFHTVSKRERGSGVIDTVNKFLHMSVARPAWLGKAYTAPGIQSILDANKAKEAQKLEWRKQADNAQEARSRQADIDKAEYNSPQARAARQNALELQSRIDDRKRIIKKQGGSFPPKARDTQYQLWKREANQAQDAKNLQNKIKAETGMRAAEMLTGNLNNKLDAWERSKRGY
jgi:hypothetical protein